MAETKPVEQVSWVKSVVQMCTSRDPKYVINWEGFVTIDWHKLQNEYESDPYIFNIIIKLPSFKNQSTPKGGAGGHWELLPDHIKFEGEDPEQLPVSVPHRKRAVHGLNNK